MGPAAPGRLREGTENVPYIVGLEAPWRLFRRDGGAHGRIRVLRDRSSTVAGAYPGCAAYRASGATVGQ